MSKPTNIGAIHYPMPTNSNRTLTGVDLCGQMPLLERPRNGHSPKMWRLWVSYNNEFTTGVYLEMHPDGAIYRHDIAPNRNSKSCVKPPDLPIGSR